MESQGVGTTVEQFEPGVADGSIVGHMGFHESIGLIGRALGWEIDEIVETRAPIVSSVERVTASAHVMPGQVAGCRHTANGYSKGELKIELIHPQQIRPELEGQETGDYIKIYGDPNVSLLQPSRRSRAARARTPAPATTSRSSAPPSPESGPWPTCRCRASGRRQLRTQR